MEKITYQELEERLRDDDLNCWLDSRMTDSDNEETDEFGLVKQVDAGGVGDDSYYDSVAIYRVITSSTTIFSSNSLVGFQVPEDLNLKK